MDQTYRAQPDPLEALPQSAARAFQQAAVEAAVKEATGKDRDSFLFCIPVQVGPATPYAQNVKSWMKTILLMQASVCVCRFVFLQDLVGGFWMLLICGLGWYAYTEDMNITYICCWGLASAVNGLFDIATLAITLLFNLIRLAMFDILLRVLAPMAELLGAGFAWHLYLDHYSHVDSTMSGVLSNMQDPLGKLVNSTDPMDYRSIAQAAKDKDVRRDLMSPFKKAGVAAAAAASRLASPTPAQRQPETPAEETLGWQQHSDALEQQFRQSSQSPFLTNDQEQPSQHRVPSPRRTYAACC